MILMLHHWNLLNIEQEKNKLLTQSPDEQFHMLCSAMLGGSLFILLKGYMVQLK